MEKYDIAIIGGDKRTACMASVFALKGYSVICFGTLETSIDDKIHHAATLQEALAKASIIVCGIPLEKNGELYFEKNSAESLSQNCRDCFGSIIVFSAGSFPMILNEFAKNEKSAVLILCRKSL